MTALSLRAYAKHIGVSDTSVRAAIRAGRIPKTPEGKIDPEVADPLWKATKTRTNEAETGQGSDGPAEIASLAEHKRRTETLKQEALELKLAKDRGELVDRSEVEKEVARLGAEERSMWEMWPDRVAALMAADVGIDAGLMHATLTAYVRAHLEEASDIAYRGPSRR